MNQSKISTKMQLITTLDFLIKNRVSSLLASSYFKSVRFSNHLIIFLLFCFFMMPLSTNKAWAVECTGDNAGTICDIANTKDGKLCLPLGSPGSATATPVNGNTKGNCGCNRDVDCHGTYTCNVDNHTCTGVSSAVAAQLSQTNTDGVSDNKLVKVLCNAYAMIIGTGGKTLAAFAIISAGIGFFTGKVSWGLLIGIAAGIGAMFGAPSIVAAVSGDAVDVRCKSLVK